MEHFKYRICRLKLHLICLTVENTTLNSKIVISGIMATTTVAEICQLGPKLGFMDTLCL